MAVYFVVDVNIDDPQSYAEYSKQVGPMVAHAGGRFLVRGGATEMIEGNWQPQRLVVIEFADTEHFRAWYDSPEYAQVRSIRFNASTARAVLAQGVEER
ncbi:MAG: DUF1330 domain-containing protein [Chloroflexi bacterium]|nr:MAG: D-fructose-6-phosphate amidotransferase [Chloroflexi bacterium 13_1_20CM_50_12]TMD52544.1 MAG: DUF1330 domain-containing protein [Chloroflexota bacterium]TMF49077.1 MAG: DUF1330 domain-containing protein [Chloroflexota bacterium]